VESVAAGAAVAGAADGTAPEALAGAALEAPPGAAATCVSSGGNAGGGSTVRSNAPGTTRAVSGGGMRR
jgi:hypothetical protein